MPAMKLKVRAVTTNQPPQATSAARTRSVRGARRVSHSPATSSTSAAGSSQPTWPPISESSRRSSPVSPQPWPPPDGADLVAGQPAEAVVAEGELEDRVRLAAADVGTAVGRPQRDDRHPPAGADDHRGQRAEQVPQPPQQRGAAGQQVDQRERGHDQERLQHLGQEAEPDEQSGEGQPAGGVPGGLDGPEGRGGRADQQQHQQRVGVVEAEHQHRHGRQRQHAAGEQAGRRRARRTPDRGDQQPDREHALERLRHQDAPRRQAEDPHRQRHRPQRQRGLVDGDRVGGVGGAEEERLPRLRPGLRRRGVEAVAPAGGAEPPQVQHGGAGQQGDERGALPGLTGPGHEDVGGRRPGLGRGTGGGQGAHGPYRRRPPWRDAVLSLCSACESARTCVSRDGSG